MAFTPGPWTIDAEMAADGICILAQEPDEEDAGVLATVHPLISDDGDEPATANAALIAAAPDLYEMTELLEETVEYGIRQAKREGDGEGVALRTATLDRVRAVLARIRQPAAANAQ